MFHFLLCAVTALTIITGPAFATDINDEGEARLRTLLSSWIDDQKTLMNSDVTLLKTEGDILIEQAKDYYALTMPKITYSGANEGKMTLDLISINALPTDNPDDWKMSVSLPTSISINNPKDDSITTINLGPQKMSGLWSGDLNSFSKIDAEYKDINITNTKKTEVVKIDNFEIIGDLKETEDGKWSGPSKAIINNVQIQSNDNTIMRIGNINSFIEIADFSPVDRKKSLDQIKQAQENNQPIDLFSLTGFSTKNLNLKMALKDINVDMPARTVKGKAREAKALQLSNAVLSMKSKAVNDNKINYAFQMGYDGLDSKDLKELTPSKLNIEFAFNDLPFEELIALGRKLNTTSQSNPNSAKIAALQSMMTLPQILSQAKTTLQIKDTGLSNDNYKALISGDLKATANSPIGVIGDMTMQLKGLDKIVKNLEAEKENANEIKIKQINSALKNIQMIQLFSEKKGDTDVLNLTISEAGKILINDKDISLLMGQK